MKRSTLRALVCLLCVLSIFVTATACGDGGKTPDSSTTDDSTTTNASTSTTADASGSTTSGDGSSSTTVQGETTTSSQDGGTATTAVTPQPTGTQSVKKTNLTRDQVMAQMPEKLKNTTIKYMTWDNPKQQMEKDAIAEFERKTGITVDIDMIDLTEKYNILASRVASGKSPDLFRTDESWPWICKNLQPIQNLNYNFNDNAWDWDLMNDFTYNGKTYSMQLADTPFTPVACLYYDKSAIKKAEMQDPYAIWKKNPADWTWDKFFSLCDTFLKRNGNKDGYYGAIFNATYIYAYPRCFGYSNINYDYKTSTFTSMLKDPEYVKYMTTLSDAINKKYITSDGKGFEMGQILFCWDWSINAQANNIYMGNLKKRNNLGIVPIPTDSTKTVLYQQMGHGVPVGAANGEAVPYFIRYIQDRKGYNIENIYSVPNSAEVIEWTLARGRTSKNFFVGETVNNYNYITKITISPADQVKALCDTYAPEFEAVAKDQNTAVKALP